MLLNDAFLKRLDAFQMAQRAHARGGAGGLRRSRAVGSSVEFSDFRLYAPGDDPRRIDWNAFARFDKLFLKLFLDEQETTLRLLVDCSASMGDTEAEGEKWNLTLRLAALFAYLALTRYDRVCIVALQGETARPSRTLSGRQAFPEAEALLEALRPEGATRLDTALARVPVTGGRGTCVLLSDLLTPHGWTRGALSLLHRRQELSVLQILSRAELEPELNGALQLLDAEGEPALDVMVSPEALRRYDQALKAFLSETRRFCHSHALAYTQLSAAADAQTEWLPALLASGVVAAR